MLLALIFPRAQRASTFDISAERNAWLQSALRSFAIVCVYMKTVPSAIVCDHMETSLYVNFLHFLDNDDRMSSKRRNLSAFIVFSGFLCMILEIINAT